MKVDLTLLHAGVSNSHFLLLLCKKYTEKKMCGLDLHVVNVWNRGGCLSKLIFQTKKVAIQRKTA